MSHRKRKKKGSKTNAERKHASRRMLQRHGLEVGKTELGEMVKMIQDGEATFVERQSNRITVWDMDYIGRLLRVVYDKERKQIVTVLPKEATEELNRDRREDTATRFV